MNKVAKLSCGSSDLVDIGGISHGRERLNHRHHQESSSKASRQETPREFVQCTTCIPLLFRLSRQKQEHQ